MKLIIHIEHVYPPIPLRCFDWSATLNGYEPGDFIGYGPTPADAIRELIAWWGALNDLSQPNMAVRRYSARERGAFESALAGALKSAIDAHGPITCENVSSAAKRVAGITKQWRQAEIEVLLKQPVDKLKPVEHP